MRSARLLLATATATAALAIAAPGALAADGDWDNGDSSYSKEHDKDSKHDKPNGGIHTGGGALTAVNEGDWSKGDDTAAADDAKKDWEADKEAPAASDDQAAKGSGSWDSADKEEESSKGDWGSKHEKPSGGMHTGGGALANPGVTAGGLAALAVVGAGAYTMRRRNAADQAS